MILAVALLGLVAAVSGAQEPLPIQLWPNGAPGSEGKTAEESVRLWGQGERIVSQVHRPSITPYVPAAGSATGAAVIVMPGGGHRELWTDHEGHHVARWLRDHGVAAFVLKYRLAREEGSTYTVETHVLADVQQAIRVVRSRAAGWHIAPDRIGVMGFSAGGELAALAGTRPGSDSRPAFMALIYAGIPNGLTLSRETPPAFLLVGENDSSVVSRLTSLSGSIRQTGGSAELHVLAGAPHGFGIRDNNPPAVAAWPSLFYHWLLARGIVTDRAAVWQVSPQMRDGISGARAVPIYSVAERQAAAHRTLRLPAPPAIGVPISLTPNAPYGPGGARLSVWKPSFVLGTPGGGEIGVNFWGIHNEGHVNVGFTATAAQYLLDCRLLSAGDITWKVFSGPGEDARGHGQSALHDGHFMLLVPAQPGELVSVELWPTPVTQAMGFLGCDLSPVAWAP